VANETVIGMTAILGYARVSTTGQDLDAQLAGLTGAGVDTVVVTAIDRLGRSVAEVTRTIADLGERRILLRASREGIDTATPTGRAVAAIMATLAELELELGRERRNASRQSRRARHLPATKPPKLSLDRQEQLRRLAATGEPVRELAKAFGIGRATALPLPIAADVAKISATRSYARCRFSFRAWRSDAFGVMSAFGEGWKHRTTSMPRSSTGVSPGISKSARVIVT
jgi:hypothetical protein